MDYLSIGKLVKPYGLKGLIKTDFYIDDFKDLKSFSRFYIVNKIENSGYKEIVFEKVTLMNGRFIVKVAGCSDRNEAELLRNREIFVDEAELPELKKDVFYIKDLQDLEVYHKGTAIGKVSNVLFIANKTMLIVKLSNSREIVFPFESKYVEKVELKDKAVYAQNIEDFF